MLKAQNTEIALRNFAERVVKATKLNLGATHTIKGNDGKMRRRRIDASGALRNNFGYELNVGQRSFSLAFISPEYQEYGKFQDYGVSGTRNKVPNPIANNSFSFKSESVGKAMQESILSWMKNKPVRLRDVGTGKFKGGGEAQKNSVAYLIARSIKRRGIAQTLFFYRPFQMNFDLLPKEISEAYALDIDDFLNYTLKNG
jgi:hypothetical protein